MVTRKKSSGKGDKENTMTENVTVADAIKQLRAQIEDAQREGAGKGLRFLAKSVEVELAIVFKNELEGEVGVKAWFLGRNDRESLPVQAKARDQFSRKQRGGFEFWSDPDVSRGTAGLQTLRWRKPDSNPRSPG
jgi:hypothetical protein